MTGAPDLSVNCQIFLMFLFLSVTKHFLEADFIYYVCVCGGGGGVAGGELKNETYPKCFRFLCRK